MSDDIGNASNSAPGAAPAASRAGGGAEGRSHGGGPLTPAELRQSFLRPDVLAAHVLGSPDRLGRNLSSGASLWLLTVLLSAASLLATLPYGAFSPVAGFWKVSVLFTGSLLICLPCLYVVLQFLGFKITLVRNLSLSLVITATAALFTLGLFPIIWFIDQTTRAGDGSAITPADLSRLLLVISLLMGIIQMFRCLAASRGGDPRSVTMMAPILVWIGLLVFIVFRMAGVLGIRA